MTLKTITSILCLLIFFSCGKEELIMNEKVVDIYAEIEPYWDDYFNSSINGWSSNDEGRFSWDDSYALEGLIHLFQSTNDVRYLDNYIAISDRILLNSDTRSGYISEYRNNLILPGWSSTRYTKDNSRHIFNVTEAMILYRFLLFVNIVNQSNYKGTTSFKKYENYADQLFGVTRTNFKLILQPTWVQVNSSEGYFRDPYYDVINIKDPLNQFAMVALVALELYKSTGDENYISYVEGVANYISQFMRVKEDAFIWSYNSIPFEILDESNIDDHGHGSIVALFIVKCFENGVIYRLSDVSKLINTFINNILNDDGSVNRNVDGSGGTNIQSLLVMYYCLAPYSMEVREELNKRWEGFEKQCDSASIFNHLGYHLILQKGYSILVSE